jgi:hypothetical protein
VRKIPGDPGQFRTYESALFDIHGKSHVLLIADLGVQGPAFAESGEKDRAALARVIGRCGGSDHHYSLL